MASTGVEYRGAPPPDYEKKNDGGVAVDSENNAYDQYDADRHPSYASVKTVRDFTHRKLKVCLCGIRHNRLR